MYWTSVKMLLLADVDDYSLSNAVSINSTAWYLSKMGDFADNMFKGILLTEISCMLIKISPEFITKCLCWFSSRDHLYMRPAKETTMRQRDNVALFLIGWTHAQNDLKQIAELASRNSQMTKMIISHGKLQYTTKIIEL